MLWVGSWGEPAYWAPRERGGASLRADGTVGTQDSTVTYVSETINFAE
jgi:hypothetical protein